MEECMVIVALISDGKEFKRGKQIKASKDAESNYNESSDLSAPSESHAAVIGALESKGESNLSLSGLP